MTTYRFSFVLRAHGAVAPVPDEVHDFAHGISAALGSGSGPSTLLLAILLLSFLSTHLSMMILLYMHVDR